MGQPLPQPGFPGLGLTGAKNSPVLGRAASRAAGAHLHARKSPMSFQVLALTLNNGVRPVVPRGLEAPQWLYKLSAARGGPSQPRTLPTITCHMCSVTTLATVLRSWGDAWLVLTRDSGEWRCWTIYCLSASVSSSEIGGGTYPMSPSSPAICTPRSDECVRF